MGALAAVDDGTVLGDSDFPRMIGDYEIIQPIGRGGVGHVCLARQTKLGREVALKLLATHRLANPRMKQRFESEMRAIGRLSHPNIVAAYDAREIEGTPALVMEFVDGFDLSQLVHRLGALSVANACEIARQVATALDYTDAAGFVHRDIKPSNIMLSSDGEVKLLDLGLARLSVDETADTTATGQAMGTADYVSPEQVSDSRNVDIRADIYSLGCTLFKLLSCRAPFADTEHVTTFSKMTAHVSEAAPALRDVLPGAPLELARLVDRMLQKLPADRPQSPDELAKELGQFTRGADLVGLAEAASKAEPFVKPSPATVATSESSSETHSFLFRPVPMLAAIAAGVVGTAFGVCLGILITIKQPDGTTTTVRAPAGSKIEISEVADVKDMFESRQSDDGVSTSQADKAADRPSTTDDVPHSFTHGAAYTTDEQRTTLENLVYISRACKRHRDVYGRFPGTAMNVRPVVLDGLDGSAYIKEETRPYSWRVAILPFIEQQALYDEYRFDEPWDSKHNQTVAKKIPDIYRIRGPHGEPQNTNILGFVGERTGLGTGNGVDVSDFQDEIYNTILVVAAATGVPWTKPEDITFDAQSTKAPQSLRRGSQVSGDSTLYVAFADGTAGWMHPVNWRNLKQLITRDGGELATLLPRVRSLPLPEVGAGSNTATRGGHVVDAEHVWKQLIGLLRDDRRLGYNHSPSGADRAEVRDKLRTLLVGDIDIHAIYESDLETFIQSLLDGNHGGDPVGRFMRGAEDVEASLGKKHPLARRLRSLVNNLPTPAIEVDARSSE